MQVIHTQLTETLVNTHRGARDPDRFRIPRVAAMLRGDKADFQASVNRAYETRHSSIAKQVATGENIMRQIEREQERGQHVCHVFEDDLRGMER